MGFKNMSIYNNNVLFQNKVFFLREEYGNGQGTFIYPNGWYSGEWEKGKIQGKGTFSWFNGDKYEGEWRVGKEHGKGTFIWSDGVIYEGEWKNGRPHGQGTGTLPDGRKYVGEYKDGKRHGQGTYTHHDGRKYEGEWKDGEVWNGIVYDSKQNIIETWLNGLEE